MALKLPAPNALVCRLLGETAVRERWQILGSGDPPGHPAGVELLAACTHWPAVRAVLQRLAAERCPTLVYGDYDVDGVIASTLLWRWLRAHGVPGNVFLPSRFKHGYGLDAETIAQAGAQGYKALVALDCGAANLEEVRQARAAGLEVVIIDHHELKDELPAAPMLNPHLEPALPPLCTAGLVYTMLQELNAAAPQQWVGDELELAGLATIADVVPLTPYNWLLAHQALAALPETINPGLLALLKVSKLHGLARITAQQAAFQLIPRINASGRMQSARISLDLLLAQNHDDARQLAQRIEALNEQRKTAGERTFREAALQAAQFQELHALAVYHPEWPVGVLGIVAARVAQQFGKPAIILADDPRQPELLSGSARSDGQHDLTQMLATVSAGVYSFGGHADAAGLKVYKNQLDDFRAEWSQAAVQESGRRSVAPVPAPAATITLAELTANFEADMWQLQPFGQGYATPCCTLQNCRVARVAYMGRDKTHLSLVVTDGVREVRLAAFNQSHLFPRLQTGTPIRPVVEIDVDNWNNDNSITLRLLALD